ncbi:hypothetical protein Vretimale_5963 [Volvox reticuliferus]|uniref:Carbonic anhydrase n=1 Tax=Volvox reticuliferus TaxID=1737510 RepID=A0A8J4G6Q8_9CHLO|nr:hypothetical protein Vretimale_5963 [Volvox reticuliferus]
MPVHQDMNESVQAEFLKNNAEYAATFKDSDLPLPPARHALVLACMDARLHVEKVLGIKNGTQDDSGFNHWAVSFGDLPLPAWCRGKLWGSPSGERWLSCECVPTPGVLLPFFRERFYI